MALASSIVGGIILLGITASWGACIRVLCVDTAAEEGCPSSTGCSCPVVGAIVTVELPSFDASSVIIMGFGAVVCSSDIIGLMGLAGVPPVLPVSSDAIFHR